MDVKDQIRQGIVQTLKERGGRITHQRLEIIDILLNVEEPQTVNEILQKLAGSEQSIGLDTIYRNVKTLVELGVVNQIGGSGKKGSRFELSDGHHHHIVCTICGHMECLHHCPVDEKRLQDEVGRAGFSLSAHRLELFGLCKNCREN